MHDREREARDRAAAAATFVSSESTGFGRRSGLCHGDGVSTGAGASGGSEGPSAGDESSITTTSRAYNLENSSTFGTVAASDLDCEPTDSRDTEVTEMHIRCFVQEARIKRF